MASLNYADPVWFHHILIFINPQISDLFICAMRCNIILLLATVLLAVVSQCEATKVRVNWSPSRGVRVALPKGRGYKYSGNVLSVSRKIFSINQNCHCQVRQVQDGAGAHDQHCALRALSLFRPIVAIDNKKQGIARIFCFPPALVHPHLLEHLANIFKFSLKLTSPLLLLLLLSGLLR
jgi:hypothetical protein